MLSYKNRLIKKKDFENILKNGRFVNGDYFVLRFAENNLDNSRFGFVVSSKVSKKAVDRNKIKRRLREIVKSLVIEVKSGFDVLIAAKTSIKKATFGEMHQSVKKYLERTKLLNQ